MNITVVDKIYPIPMKVKASPETESFLHFLLSDNYFKKKLVELRKKYHIPEKGYDLGVLYDSWEVGHWLIEGLSLEKTDQYFHLVFYEDYIFPKKIEEKELDKLMIDFFKTLSTEEYEAIAKHQQRFDERYNKEKPPDAFSYYELEHKMDDDLEELCHHYNVHSGLSGCFFLLIAFNAFINFHRDPQFLFLVDQEDIVNEIQGSKKSPIGALIFFEQTSKRALINWINLNWEDMQDRVEKLAKTPSVRSTNLSIAEEIHKLRGEGKKYAQISTLLSEKYPDDNRVYDESWVKETHRRYKLKMNEFIKKTH